MNVLRRLFARPRRPRLLALLAFRDEMRFLPDWFRNVPPQVDGVVALDDGSRDGSGDFVAAQPALIELLREPSREPHRWDEPRNRRRLIAAGLAHGADWLLAVDADERLERGFRVRAEPLLRARRGAAYYLHVRELWDDPLRFRADGVWGGKRSARLFRARPGMRLDDRPLHGHWAPLDARRRGDFPPADLLLYHLRMLSAADRAARRAKYERLDPDARSQEIGYAYLTDERGLRLAPIAPERGYEPLPDFSAWPSSPPGAS